MNNQNPADSSGDFFYKNFFRPPSKEETCSKKSKSPKDNTSLPESKAKKSAPTSPVKHKNKAHHKQPSVDKLQEMQKKYDQDLQLAYYSDFSLFNSSGTLSKKGKLHMTFRDLTYICTRAKE